MGELHSIGLLALLAATCVWSVGSATVKLKLPDLSASVFAEEAIDFRVAEAGDEGCYWSEGTADALLGPPPEQIRNGEYDYVPLGSDGFVIVRMEAAFTTGIGTDLRVHAAPHQGYGRYDVAVSADGADWVDVASEIKSDNTVTWYASIDFGHLGGQYKYVKVTAVRGGACTPYILAIEALFPCEEAPPPQTPRARFGFAPPDPLVGTAIRFDAASSSDADGVIQSYTWDFGDGASESGKTVSHSYLGSGSFTVTLEVTDNDGLVSQTSRAVQVGEAERAPMADFTYRAAGAGETDTTAELYVGKQILFDASASFDPDGRILEYAWDWDADSLYDELTAEDTIEHAFDHSGSCRVSLRVIDNSGLTDVVTRTIEIVEPSSPEQTGVLVLFGSIPEGAEVEIDGYFVGNTPLEHALVLDSVYEVRVSLPGYNAWVRTIKVFEGLVVNAVLVQASGG